MICKHLLPVLELEKLRGNEIEEISNGWSKANVVIDLKYPLSKTDVDKLFLPDFVKYWENRDTHYKVQCGYYCETCKHSIAGPLNEGI